MKKRSMWLLLALLVALSAVLSGCSSGGSKNTGDPSPGQTSQEKVLRIGTPYSVGTLLPWKVSSDGDRYIVSNIYESLVQNDVGPFFGPSLAESWTNIDDNTYEFKLHKESYWHTGNELFKDEKVPVTAEDVKASFEFYLDESNGALARNALLNDLDKIEIVDEYTIRLITKKPTAMFLRNVSKVQILPMKAFETNFDLQEYPVGSGPYKFKEYDADNKVVLVKNTDYYIEPKLDEVVFKIIPDKAVAAIALQNDEVDIVPQILSTDVKTIASNDSLKLIPNNAGWYRYIAFNTSNELFSDIKVREAISMAIDFEAIVDNVFSNDANAKLAVFSYGGGVPPELPGYDIETWKKSYEYNPEKAAQLLEEAGWKKDSSGIYTKGGKKFSFTIKVQSNDNPRVKFGDMCATYLKSLGIDCSTQTTEFATLSSDIASGDTQMFIMGGASGLDGMSFLYHSEGAKTSTHNTFLVDKEIDSLIDTAYATIDDAKREELLKKAANKAVLNKIHPGGYFEYVQIGMNKDISDFEQRPSLQISLTSALRNIDINK